MKGERDDWRAITSGTGRKVGQNGVYQRFSADYKI
jgi:hypothetical protein